MCHWSWVLLAAETLLSPQPHSALCIYTQRAVWKLLSFSPSISSRKQRHLLSPPCLKFELEMMSWDSWIKSAQVYLSLTSLGMSCWVERNSESFPAGKPTLLLASVRRQNLIPARPELLPYPLSPSYSLIPYSPPSSFVLPTQFPGHLRPTYAITLDSSVPQTSTHHIPQPRVRDLLPGL